LREFASPKPHFGGLCPVNWCPPSPVGRLKKTLDLYADIRVIKSYPGVWNLRADIDLIMIRENTQGFLADRSLNKGYGEFMPDEDTVLSLRVLTRKAYQKIMAGNIPGYRNNRYSRPDGLVRDRPEDS
jgi:3-isopropylmalate dehydrogenase